MSRRDSWMPSPRLGMTEWVVGAGALTSRKLIVEVLPLRIGREDEPDFQGARPALQNLLPLNRRADVLMAFGPHQALQSVAFREAWNGAGAVLPGAMGKIAGDADVERAVGSVRHDVDPAALHAVQSCRGSSRAARVGLADGQ